MWASIQLRLLLFLFFDALEDLNRSLAARALRRVKRLFHIRLVDLAFFITDASTEVLVRLFFLYLNLNSVKFVYLSLHLFQK